MSVVLAEDKVWFDEAHKLEQLCNEIAALQSAGRSVLLLSHFDATLVSLESSLTRKGIRHERFSSLNPSELCSNSSSKVWLASTRAFHVGTVTPSRSESTSEIIVAEHHPMQSRDQELVDAAANLPCQVKLTFCFSLDDPLMKHFGNETVKSLFERLGIDKNECISHHFINAAIRSAQEKLENKIGKDVDTYSAEDWFRYNLRN